VLGRHQALSAESPSPKPSQPTIQTPSNNLLSEDLQRLTNRVLELEIDMAKAAKSREEDWLVSLAPSLATLFVGILALWGIFITGKREERRTAYSSEHAKELARQEALFQHTEKIVEFRLKQMELFYAPMFALLEQSRALYDKLLFQLEHDEPERYKQLAIPDPEGFRFHVRAKNGSWQGFRLLDQLPAMRDNSKALVFVEGILDIGGKMTKIISERAGFASRDLVDLLGEYLAHYTILSTIHKQGETVPYEPGWHKMGYYPIKLNEKIKRDYYELSEFIDQYAEASKYMLQALPSKTEKGV
jgi:hypothetical protein